MTPTPAQGQRHNGCAMMGGGGVSKATAPDGAPLIHRSRLPSLCHHAEARRGLEVASHGLQHLAALILLQSCSSSLDGHTAKATPKTITLPSQAMPRCPFDCKQASGFVKAAVGKSCLVLRSVLFLFFSPTPTPPLEQQLSFFYEKHSVGCH